MRPDISEFSYGYAITDELINWHGTKLTAAPVFPSLYREGQAGGGYDLRLDRPGIPLFLQFKLTDCMVRNTGREVRNGLLTIPYYRMHIRPSRHSAQHEMLHDLENSGNEVYYSAPVFHTPAELNDAYLTHNVKNRSVWVKPSQIGLLPDDRDHYIAFQNPPSKIYFCSEPRMLDGKSDFDNFSGSILSRLHQSGKSALTSHELIILARQLVNISEKWRDMSEESRKKVRENIQDKDTIEQIAFYSQAFFECQLFVVHERES